MNEADFIAALRRLAHDPAARGLADDVAVIGDLIFSHDSIVAGIHYLASDPPESVARKLVAVNLSDLAAKGAEPVAALMAYTLSGDSGWDAAFIEGLAAATTDYALPLIGGDTVALPPGSARVTGLTVIGRSRGPAPPRSGARSGDALFVTGTIGDAGLGLHVAQGKRAASAELLAAYRTPQPQLAAGRALGPIVSAMMDVSDGLLIDAQRLSVASGVAVRIDLDAVPLSAAFVAVAGDDAAARMMAASAGDDYQLLFTSHLPLPRLPCRVTRIGQVMTGAGLSVISGNTPVPLPPVLGWQHGDER